MRLRPKTVKFRASGGIEPFKLRYTSSELDRLRDHLGARATIVIFVDPDRLTSVKVLNPITNALFIVPCVEDHGYASSVTEAQHRMIVALQRSRGINNPAIKDFVQGREILAQMVAEARLSNKYLLRKRARHIEPFDDVAPPVVNHPKDDEFVVMTELEFHVAEFETIDMGEEDW